MNNLIKVLFRRPLLTNLSIARSISFTPLNRIKQIEITQEKDELTIRGKIVPSGREALIVPEFKQCKSNCETFCPECTLGLDIKHTDVLIISQYVRKDGCMLPRRVTGLCKRMQKRIGTMVTMAHKAGLLPNLKPEYATKAREPSKRRNHKAFNTYYDESTIIDPGAKRPFKWTNYKNNSAYAKARALMN